VAQISIARDSPLSMVVVVGHGNHLTGGASLVSLIAGNMVMQSLQSPHTEVAGVASDCSRFGALEARLVGLSEQLAAS